MDSYFASLIEKIEKSTIFKNDNKTELVQFVDTDTSIWGENALLIEWFLNEKDLPQLPFNFDQATRITDPKKFYQSLRMDIKEGPLAWRSKNGALLNDLQKLKNQKTR
jgi:hypothetical protein